MRFNSLLLYLHQRINPGDEDLQVRDIAGSSLSLYLMPPRRNDERQVNRNLQHQVIAAL